MIFFVFYDTYNYCQLLHHWDQTKTMDDFNADDLQQSDIYELCLSDS